MVAIPDPDSERDGIPLWLCSNCELKPLIVLRQRVSPFGTVLIVLRQRVSAPYAARCLSSAIQPCSSAQ